MDEAKARAFGLFISRRREGRGLSQVTLAAAAGISRAYLAQIETGRRIPGDETFRKLLVALGASMQEFMAEMLEGEIPAEQLEGLTVLTQTFDKMQELLTPEQVTALLEASPTAEQLDASLALIGGLPAVPAPDGWTDLSAQDRRLVQRLVNRLRKGSTAAKEADDGDE